MYQKPSETGWFYHAPPRPAVGPEVGVPPPSQIPCLAGDMGTVNPEPIPRTRILETDSKYVRLAKAGGREDLLQFTHPGKRSDQPQAYPRVDWFYLEDIRAEEEEKYNAQKKQSHTFLLPDYMVHEAYNPQGNPDGVDQRFQPKRAPYNYDTTTAFQKDSRPTDKTVRLPEVKRDGYGIRCEKLKDKPIRHNVPMPQRGKPPPAELSPEKKYEMCLLPEDERPVMSKILSFGYAKDWDDVRNKWQDKQNPKEDGKGSTFYGPPDKTKPKTEYQTQINEKAPRSGGSQTKNRERSRRNSGTSEKSAKAQQKEKEMFKMARFKNVPAKIDSQRIHQNAVQAH